MNHQGLFIVHRLLIVIPHRSRYPARPEQRYAPEGTGPYKWK